MLAVLCIVLSTAAHEKTEKRDWPCPGGPERRGSRQLLAPHHPLEDPRPRQAGKRRRRANNSLLLLLLALFLLLLLLGLLRRAIAVLLLALLGLLLFLPPRIVLGLAFLRRFR